MTTEISAALRATSALLAYFADHPNDLPETLRPLFRGPEVSTELAIFDGAGNVLLAKRPSATESPNEPYPDQWYVPGLVHEKGESWSSGLTRLKNIEAGGNVRLDECHLADVIPSGGRMCFVAVTRMLGGSIIVRAQNQFHDIGLLPESLVPHHRVDIIPTAVKKARELGWKMRSDIDST